jgi:hypothetical protein
LGLSVSEGSSFCHVDTKWQKLELSLTLAYAKTTSNDR